MITVEFFNYTDAQWNAVKAVVYDALGIDADQIERPILSVLRDPRVRDLAQNVTGMVTLRSRIETTISQYPLYSDVNDRSPRRNELERLRDDAENLRASIINALAIPFDAKYGVVVPMLLNGVDADMLTATRDYFRKLARNLDRQIEQAGTSRNNARKTARDQCWNELLAIWRELDGKPTGQAAASFIRAASKPVMGSAVPTLKSVVQWLERQSKALRRKAR